AAGKFVDTFRAFQELKRQGRVRSIGVSNFTVDNLRTLIAETGEIPAVNQIELHPALAQRELREFHAENAIATEAWSPLGQGTLLEDATITRIAQEVGRTPAQVIIRWHLQLGNIVIPKSVTPARIEANFDVFGFELSREQMAAIDGLDRGGRIGPDPDTFSAGL
ncbi:aldo/keto reductase, partial [Nocardia elegans]|uniref:aldo/keto reductase n=1 Tax=Nocardia elegans TaxID=300029 RepID=UPI0018938CB7